MGKKKKKKFKGEYKGPDRFKGDEKKIKKWKKSDAGKKVLAKRRRKRKQARVNRAKPAAPQKKDTAKLIKTKKTGVPVLQTAFLGNTTEQNQDILNAFLAFSGTELFQYTNSQSIDGIFSDVSIISVLSSRRKDYKPNDIIALNPPFINRIYRGTGTAVELNKLYVDVGGVRNGGEIVLDFYIEKPEAQARVQRIGTVEY